MRQQAPVDVTAPNLRQTVGVAVREPVALDEGGTFYLRLRVGAPYYYNGEAATRRDATRRVRISALLLKNCEAGGHRQWIFVQIVRSMASQDRLMKRVLTDTLLPCPA
ncbi:hypothetical protein [Massilia sp.]|uniref:hypothetical protein n=1 Tax=Massilia sp. TaxID=1882437 RepID=UPI00352CE792